MTEVVYYLPFGPEIELGQPYGARPGLTPNPPGGHNGDDWLTWVGVPVRAAGDGVVVYAGEFDSTYADNFGWNLNYGGRMVVLNMDGQFAPYFEYGHLSDIYVQTGDRVTAGEIIALSGESDGNTGVISGPHCHVGCLPYDFNLGSSTYGRVNPRIFMTKHWDDAISIQPQGAIVTKKEGFLMALSDADQVEVLAHTRDINDDTDAILAAIRAMSTDLNEVVGNARKLVHSSEDIKSALRDLPVGEIADLIPEDLVKNLIEKLGEKLSS